MQNLLNSAYSREDWISFLQNRFLPDDFQLRKEAINIDFKSNYIQPTAFWIGDCASLGDLAIIEIYHNSAKDPRIGVSRDAFRLMALHNLDKALFFFVSDNSKNFRFSLITLDLQLKGKKVEYQFSNPKRFSFFLGEGAKIKTPHSFLIAKSRVRSFADLQERFSVEVVNKEFYQEIQSLFYRLVGGKIKVSGKLQDFPARLCLPDAGNSQQRQEFGVRLIGRLVFCWFLKKKLSDGGLPLIPDAVLSSQAVVDSYYHKVLEPLFFEILNTPLGKREAEFRSPLYDIIPFLNGGLFDPSLHQDYYYHLTSAQKHQPSYTLKVPDDWLRDFFSTLETYNFTIDENIPIDIDLSVDPEMLGRIFENLLAEINPETGKNAQNATGSFYTPRPIVEYMVDESLVQYLLHHSSVSEADLRALVDYNIETVELSKAQCKEILQALDSIKVLDPACGSGAFPIGMLQKMLLILQKVDPESVDWIILQLDKVPVSIRKSVEDKLMDENWSYRHKMGIIQNAIYGVDLQPIATEISKLRLFLTLIVDEKIIDNQPNRNINPLPNLSFKFVSANTLLPLPDSQQEEQMEALDFDSLFEPKIQAMQRAREDYFFAYGDAKEKLIQKFKEVQQELSREFFSSGSVNKRALALANWEPFSDKASDWFDPAWIFGIKEGFDIVIGNPPYIQLQKDLDGTKKYADLYKNIGYQSFERTGDIYCLFYEKGYELLKLGGHITFITSNKWMRAGYGESLRRFLSANTRPQTLLDLSAIKVFDNATVDTNILVFQKTKPQPGSGYALSFQKDYQKNDNLYDYVHEKQIPMPAFGADSWVISDDLSLKLKAKIEAMGTPLKDWDVSINYGIKTGFNEAFIISGAKKAELIEQDHRSAEIIKPVLRGKDIRRYQANFADLWLIFIPWHFPLHKDPSIQGASLKAEEFFRDEYPAIYRHLEGYKERLSARNKAETGIRYEWYALQRCAATYYEEFEKERIVYRQVGVEMDASLIPEGYFINDKLYMISGKNLRFLIALLNSKLFNNVQIKNASITGGKGESFLSQISLPIPPQPETWFPFTDKIFELKKQEEDTQTYEDQIDLMVYKLYDLNYEEMRLIDPNLDQVLASFGLDANSFAQLSLKDLQGLIPKYE